MPHPDNDTQAGLWRAWTHAAGQPAVDASLRRCYSDLDAEAAGHQPICSASGRCCRFDSFGHRLYVTGLEIAWLLARLPGEQSARITEAVCEEDLARRDGCPFQENRLCCVHAIRPLGCRVFFCQPDDAPWQQQLYEKYLGRLRAIHERWRVPYRYMEWRAGLRDAMLVMKAAVPDRGV